MRIKKINKKDTISKVIKNLKELIKNSRKNAKNQIRNHKNSFKLQQQALIKLPFKNTCQ